MAPEKLAEYLKKAITFLRTHPENHNQSYYFFMTDEGICSWCVIGKTIYDIICDFGLKDQLVSLEDQCFRFTDPDAVNRELAKILKVPETNPITMLGDFFPRISKELNWCRVAVSNKENALKCTEDILAHYGY